MRPPHRSARGLARTRFSRSLTGSAPGFSLIEVLVVIAVIALLLGLLAPALAKARAGAQRTRSLEHLRQGATLIAIYATSTRDEFLNPFASGDGPLNQPWVWMQNPPGGAPFGTWGYCFGAPFSHSGTESYGYHWWPLLMLHEEPLLSRVSTTIAPGDRALHRWLRTNNDQNAQNWIDWNFPTSYWYPPVFWQDSARFSGLSRPDSHALNNWHFRRNKVADVGLPDRKVLLFEGKDYHEKGQPMWNHPRARPGIALIDGSVRGQATRELVTRTKLPGVEEDEPGLEAPSGVWSPGEAEMDQAMMYGRTQGFAWEYGRPAYYWATQGGLRGRDVP